MPSYSFPPGAGGGGGGGGGGRAHAIVTKSGNSSIVAADQIVQLDSSGGAFNLALPDPSTVVGYLFYLVDIAGFLQANPVTLTRFGAEEIEGLAADKALQTSWGGWTLYSDGTDWFLI